MSDEALGTLVITIGVCVVAFLVLRSVMLWYWKVNRIVELLEQQNKLLTALADKTERANLRRCPSCHGTIQPNAQKCPHCGAEFAPAAPSDAATAPVRKVPCVNCGKEMEWSGKGVVSCQSCGRVQLPVP